MLRPLLTVFPPFLVHKYSQLSFGTVISFSFFILLSTFIHISVFFLLVLFHLPSSISFCHLLSLLFYVALLFHHSFFSYRLVIFSLIEFPHSRHSSHRKRKYELSGHLRLTATKRCQHSASTAWRVAAGDERSSCCEMRAANTSRQNWMARRWKEWWRREMTHHCRQLDVATLYAAKERSLTQWT